MDGTNKATESQKLSSTPSSPRLQNSGFSHTRKMYYFWAIKNLYDSSRLKNKFPFATLVVSRKMLLRHAYVMMFTQQAVASLQA